ncbi:Histone deacetylase [Sulfidibacter corallicola]|uniref:Histone deacetylase n=1 Tax=Sulfidibacter corallicola TaxID=2818388 RepID=A0A8A4TRD3_SULCO|nr:histone deacetylase [Sulfidibacter corallicola]QTD52529.1 histone deacetylase [Sulfidibacter corallicola]
MTVQSQTQTVAYISPTFCLKHETGLGHPERAQRLSAMNRHLKETGLIGDVTEYAAREATEAEIAAVHPLGYIEYVSNIIRTGGNYLDGDTTVCRDSLTAANLAAGSALTGLELMKRGTHRRVFCGVRPPGHHAELSHAMGFCIFNNVAVAARFAQAHLKARRVLIIDWDVHHGNGTQHIFERDPTVFYYSCHQYPFYPGTGRADERGRDDGTGYTLNRPMTAGAGDLAYLKAFEKDLTDISDRFKPNLIIVSAGFDAHRDDPLGSMQMTESGFAEMTEMVVSLAETHCDGRILSVLEGGYDLDGLSKSVAAHLVAMR